MNSTSPEPPGPSILVEDDAKPRALVILGDLLVLEKRDDLERPPRCGKRDDCNVQRVLLQPVQNVRGVARPDDDLQTRAPSLQITQDWREQVDAGGRASADGYTPNDIGLVIRESIYGSRDRILDRS